MGAIHHVPAGSGPCITYGGQVINLKMTAAESGGEVMIMEDAIAAGGGPPLHVHERENATNPTSPASGWARSCARTV